MFGAFLWEMMARKTPFAGHNLIDIAVGVARQGWHLEPPEGCDPVFARLMTACFQFSPNDRPDMGQISSVLDQYHEKLSEKA